jgi:anaerobic magnesium-protoporphyrin IX monomethyl ester cyclase
MYGNIDGQIEFPTTPDEWASKRWMDYTLRINPNTPWLTRKTKDLIDNFETVVSSRWPTVQDIRAPRWSRALLKTLSAWRYSARIYAYPKELRWAHQFINLRKPKAESL